MTLLDTNILLRLVKHSDPLFPTALAAVVKLEQSGDYLFMVPQNLYEFWTAATRPIVNNGLGLSATEATVEMSRIRRTYPMLMDTLSLVSEWERLVITHGCTGKPAHDARLVAAMHVHFIPQILTFNVADFGRYPGITAIDPAIV